MNRKNILVVLASIFVVVGIAKADEAALYAKHCKKCHAEDGSGKKGGEWLPVAKSLKLEKPEGLDLLSADAKKLTDDDILKSMLEGKGKMKSLKDKVTPEEAKSLVAYVRTLQSKTP